MFKKKEQHLEKQTFGKKEDKNRVNGTWGS